MPVEECVPPATFRCNRKRMVMIVRVTMHHVNPSQVSLTTTAKAIDLTTSGRRRLVLRRDFPRGVDSRASGPLLVTVVTVVTVFERRTLYSFELDVAPPAIKLRM